MSGVSSRPGPGAVPLEAALPCEPVCSRWLDLNARCSRVKSQWIVSSVSKPFYDTPNVIKVLDRAMARGYPKRPLALSLQTSTAPRVIRAKGTVTKAILTTTSVGQGCGSSTDHARNYLYDALDHLANSDGPAEVNEVVDDIEFWYHRA